MLIRIGLILFILTCVQTTEDEGEYYNGIGEIYRSQIINAIRKRQADLSEQKLQGGEVKTEPLNTDKVNDSANKIPAKASSNEETPKSELVVGESEGGAVKEDNSKSEALVPQPSEGHDEKNTKTELLKGNATVAAHLPILAPHVTNSTAVKSNGTLNTSEDLTSESLVNKPGVVKRGLIVFGGFSLLAAAYFVFYRKKSKSYDSNTHSNNDTNQFRYGVLQSDDRRDNLELSQIPLTMESDDEEEDLEIFDLEQKKKSLSYVNLQVNDEDIVLNGTKDESKNNLLLDIEDGSSDTLINWSSNGNKSIL
ncbi:uncharacterized protein LOC116766324 [Danaus plexippus]|uniref:uncharacterized protein LOC116766324 n=1 Tax=Danaus plexippus TaxID=13037 RepID=UPI002AB25A2E|nr:uncharacterized protein LOC116766324 [Danaus plexippus]